MQIVGMDFGLLLNDATIVLQRNDLFGPSQLKLTVTVGSNNLAHCRSRVVNDVLCNSRSCGSSQPSWQTCLLIRSCPRQQQDVAN